MATKKRQTSSAKKPNEQRKGPELVPVSGRKDEVGRSGVYPFTSAQSPKLAEVRTAGSWGQGERGGKGYEDHGGSELTYQAGHLLGALEGGGDNLAAHPQAGDVEIVPEEWIAFSTASAGNMKAGLPA
jgi:hypothetical protein